RDRMRRSRLYVPGSEPKYFINAALHGADAIILDLEDSVHPNEKDAARLLVRNALRAVDFLACERMVRINQLPLGMERAYEIATAAREIAALTIGLEDYTADLGVAKTAGGAESLFARQRMVN